MYVLRLNTTSVYDTGIEGLILYEIPSMQTENVERILYVKTHATPPYLIMTLNTKKTLE